MISNFIYFLTIPIIVVHTQWLTCEEKDYCKELRKRAPENRYAVNKLLESNDDIVKWLLVPNDATENLILELSALNDSSYRVKIQEEKSTRYQLKDVLPKEPEPLNFDNLEEDSEKTTLTFGEDRIIVFKSPFIIELYKNNVLETIFDGKRLFLETGDKYEKSQPFTFGVTFPEAKSVYGLHEHIEHLSLQDTIANNLAPYRLKNLDYGGSTSNPSLGLYGSVPVLYGHSANATSGIFLHNAAEEWIDIEKSDDNITSYFVVQSSILDLFIFLGPKPADVFSQYITLIGTSIFPPLWALGHHQCRWSYMNQEEVKDVVANFDNYNFSLDVIWLDIDYTDRYEYFTWNPETFSNPIELQQNISATNRKMVVIIDPHIKIDENYPVYAQALKNEYFVKLPSDAPFVGDSWPGSSSWIDFLNPLARDFYASQYSYENFTNSTSTIVGIWNDMNEPSVSNGYEKTIDDDALHANSTYHRDIHNIYGLLHTKSTYQGLLARDDNKKRPFVLSRSFFAGSQRYTTHWTGDSDATWEFLQYTIPMCLNANILGMVFCGSDVGGFNGNPDEELLQRWYQAGIWQPFFRAHAAQSTEHREPYLYPSDIQDVIRQAITLRYQHIPVWYTLMYEHIRNVTPIIRPLFYHYPEDRNVFEIDNHVLLGSDILARPVIESGVSSVEIYFPGNESVYWFSVADSNVYRPTGHFQNISVDIHSNPYFYKSGSVIVRKDTIRRNTVEMESDAYTLYVAPDQDGKAHGTVFIDDGISFEYRDNSSYNYLSIDVDNNTVEITSAGKFNEQFDFIVENIIIFSVIEAPDSGNNNIGKALKQKFYMDVENNRFNKTKLDLSKSVTWTLKDE